MTAIDINYQIRSRITYKRKHAHKLYTDPMSDEWIIGYYYSMWGVHIFLITLVISLALHIEI